MGRRRGRPAHASPPVGASSREVFENGKTRVDAAAERAHTEAGRRFTKFSETPRQIHEAVTLTGYASLQARGFDVCAEFMGVGAQMLREHGNDADAEQLEEMAATAVALSEEAEAIATYHEGRAAWIIARNDEIPLRGSGVANMAFEETWAPGAPAERLELAISKAKAASERVGGKRDVVKLRDNPAKPARGRSRSPRWRSRSRSRSPARRREERDGRRDDRRDDRREGRRDDRREERSDKRESDREDVPRRSPRKKASN